MQPLVVNINLSLEICCFGDCLKFSVFVFVFYFFFTFILQHDSTQSKSQKTKIWAKLPLNQSCSVFPAASGFSTGRDSSWESHQFAADFLLLCLPFTWVIFLIFLHMFQEAFPQPPVRQDFFPLSNHTG